MNKVSVSNMEIFVRMAEGETQVAIAERMGVSQPCIAKIAAKVDRSFGGGHIEGRGSGWRITTKGHDLANKLNQCLAILRDH